MTDMSVARLHEVGGPLVIERIPRPEPRPNEVVVNVEACNLFPGLKHHLRSYKYPSADTPLPPLPASFGMDAAGVVTELGSEVVDLKVGDRVYVNPGLSCGACSACLRGDEPSCDRYTLLGLIAFGPGGAELYEAHPLAGLSEYLAIPQRNVVRIPDTVSFEEAARFGYLGTAYSGLRKAGVGPGSTVLISGASGAVGVGAVVLAIAMGAAKILGTGRDAALLADVKNIAPDRIEVMSVKDLGEGELATWVRQHVERGVDVVLDALPVGAPASSYTEAIGALARGGVLASVGGIIEQPGLDLFALMAQNQSVRGSLWFTTQELQELVGLAASGLLDLSVFEHEIFGLDAVNDIVAGTVPELHGGFTNIIVRPGH